MKKKLSVVFTVIISLLQIFTAYALNIPEAVKTEASNINLEAQSAILIDASTGDILYQKNINEKQYPASITKLMTVLLAFEYGKFDETITFSHDAVFSIEPGSSHIAIDEGEQITLEQALYAIMLQSANEVSNGVAEHIAGSMDAFAEKMTQRAKELGCTNTSFVNANGLHDENHYTTANDMALISKELIKYDLFKEIMSTTYYEIPPTNKQPETRYLYGQNQLIKKSSIFFYEDCEGGKTGFTNQAGNTLVAFAKKGDTELISVVLKSTGYGEYTDTRALFDYGFKNFETKKIALKDVSPLTTTINVLETQKKKTNNLGTVKAVYSEDVIITLPKNTSVSSIKKEYNVLENYEAPIKKGQVLSEVKFIIDDNVVASSNLVADTSIFPTSQTTSESDKKPINPIFVVILLVIVAIILVIIRLAVNKIQYEKRKKRRRQKLQQYRQQYDDMIYKR